MLWIFLISFLITICSYYLRRFLYFPSFHPSKLNMPGIGLLPFKSFGKDLEDLYDTLVMRDVQQEESFGVWIVGLMFGVVLKRPEEIKIILNSDETFNKPEIFYEKVFKYGLFSENGDKYRMKRKALSPIMQNPAHFKTFIPHINESITRFLERFDANLPEEEFDVMNDIVEFSLDSVLHTMFTTTGQVSEERRRRFCFNMDQHHQMASIRFYKPFLIHDFLFKRSKLYTKFQQNRHEINKFIEEFLINEKENDYKNGNLNINENEKKKSFQDYLYGIRDKMSYDELLDTIAMAIIASYDTSGKTMSLTLLALAMNPEIQEKAYEEVKQILSSPDDFVTEDQWNKMEYLDRCIKEGLRFFPGNIVSSRKVEKDVELVDFILPAGALTLIFPRELHFDQKHWGKDVNDFNPDRFLEENFKKIHPYAYVPFTHGPRICVGYKYARMSMKMFLSRFLLKYKVTTSLTMKDIKVIPTVIATYKPGAIMSIERRQ